jgi:hypothetical protein
MNDVPMGRVPLVRAARHPRQDLPIGINRKGSKMRLKRALATVAAIVVAGFSLAACGGDDDGDNDGAATSDSSDAPDDASDAPDDATVEEFCAVWNDDSIGGGEDDTPEEQADAAHEAAAALAEVGTPEGMDDGARNGYEAFLGFLAGVDADDLAGFAEANPADPEAFAESLGIDEEDADDVIAFITYASQQCLGLATDAPTP